MARIEVLPDANSFLKECLPWLMQREDFNNGIISTATLVRDESGIFGAPYHFLRIVCEGNLIGCAIHVEPDGLLVSEMPEGAAAILADRLSETMPQIRRISGEAWFTRVLVGEFERCRGARYMLENTWNIYRLDAIAKDLPATEGKLRLCNPSERELVREWSRLYAVETPSPIDTQAFFLRKLSDNHLYVWDLNGPKAIASISSPTDNGIKISAVFTPEEARNSGFASAIVAELCRRMLAGKFSFVTLSAEDGHGSERIYHALGFRKIGTRLSYAIKGISEKLR